MPSSVRMKVRDWKILAAALCGYAAILMVLWVCAKFIRIPVPPVPDMTESPRSTWERVEICSSCGGSEVSILMPVDFRQQDVQGIDSYVGEYRSSRIELSFDIGWYSYRAKDLDCQETQLTTNRWTGRLVDCNTEHPPFAAAVFEDVPREGTHIAFYVRSSDLRAHATAIEILKSIRISN